MMINPLIAEDTSPNPFRKSPTIFTSKRDLGDTSPNPFSKSPSEENHNGEQRYQEETKVGLFLYNFDKAFNFRYYFPENNLSFLLEKIALKTPKKMKRNMQNYKKNLKNCLRFIDK